MDEKSLALIFKAMGDISRVIILKQLADGEKCANELLSVLSIGQPTLSHHMQILCKSGLVKHRKDGKWARYELNPEMFQTVVDFVDGLVSDK